VELLRIRIPPNKKVLLCTTTNKAIDSLAEKICATCGHDSVIAIGNAYRLGSTSVTLTLDEKVKRHKSNCAWVDMCAQATFVLEAYHKIQQDAIIEARKKDAEAAKGLQISVEEYSKNETLVAASMKMEMAAAEEAVREAAQTKFAAPSVGKKRGANSPLRSACMSNYSCTVSCCEAFILYMAALTASVVSILCFRSTKVFYYYPRRSLTIWFWSRATDA
jgi:hypothetical protein